MWDKDCLHCSGTWSPKEDKVSTLLCHRECLLCYGICLHYYGIASSLVCQLDLSTLVCLVSSLVLAPVHALRQELIQHLQSLGFMPSVYSCESATPSHWPHRDLRVIVDAVGVSNDLHSCSRPQAILIVRHLRSLDYEPCQRSCLSNNIQYAKRQL